MGGGGGQKSHGKCRRRLWTAPKSTKYYRYSATPSKLSTFFVKVIATAFVATL